MLKRIIYEHTVSLVCFITIKFSETSGRVFQVRNIVKNKRRFQVISTS